MARPRTASDEQLVAAAARAVGTHGPARLTLAHVADEAGVVPATLVQRFGSKRGLLLAVAASGAGSVDRVFAEARTREPGSPLAALRRALEQLTAPLRDPAVAANHVAFLAVDLTDPEFGRHAAAHMRALAARLRALLRDASAAGELHSGTDTRALAELLVCAYNGALLTWALDGRGTARARLRAQVTATLAPFEL